jgi:hypothetical protein
MLVEAKVLEGKKKHVAAKKKGVEEKPAEATPTAGNKA